MINRITLLLFIGLAFWSCEEEKDETLPYLDLEWWMVTGFNEVNPSYKKAFKHYTSNQFADDMTNCYYLHYYVDEKELRFKRTELEYGSYYPYGAEVIYDLSEIIANAPTHHFEVTIEFKELEEDGCLKNLGVDNCSELNILRDETLELYIAATSPDTIQFYSDQLRTIDICIDYISCTEQTN